MMYVEMTWYPADGRCLLLNKTVWTDYGALRKAVDRHNRAYEAAGLKCQALIGNVKVW